MQHHAKKDIHELKSQLQQRPTTTSSSLLLSNNASRTSLSNLFVKAVPKRFKSFLPRSSDHHMWHAHLIPKIHLNSNQGRGLSCLRHIGVMEMGIKELQVPIGWGSPTLPLDFSVGSMARKMPSLCLLVGFAWKVPILVAVFGSSSTTLQCHCPLWHVQSNCRP